MNFTQIIHQMVALGLSDEAIVAAVRVQARQARDGVTVTCDTPNRDDVTPVTEQGVTGVTKHKKKGMTGAERMAKCRAKKAFQARQGAFDFDEAVTPEAVTEVVTLRDGDEMAVTDDLPSPKKGPPDPLKNTPLPSEPPSESASLSQSPDGGVSLVEQKLLAVAEEIEAKATIVAKGIDRIMEHEERFPSSAKRKWAFALPNGWKPRAEAIRLANSEYGLSETQVHAIADNMRDLAMTNREFVKADWEVEFWKWIKRAGERQMRRDSRPTNRDTDQPKRFKSGALNRLQEIYREKERLAREQGGDGCGDHEGADDGDSGHVTIDADAWQQTD